MTAKKSAPAHALAPAPATKPAAPIPATKTGAKHAALASDAKPVTLALTAKPPAPAHAVKALAPARPAKIDASKTPVKPAAKVIPKAAEAAKAKLGRKGKPDEASKAAADVSDVDLSDLEADLEGEPEVESAADAESKVKVKPLRMKVSRAKERALMREFGLEETALTEEEAAKRRQELKTLIKMGKTRGFLTHQEINDHLPEKLINDEILEAIVSMLNDMGIAVYEQAPDAATLLIAGGGATKIGRAHV